MNEYFGSTYSNYPRTATVHQLFTEQVQKNPASVALSCGSSHLTYRELNERADQLSWQLIDSGAVIEEPVGILMERSIPMVIAMVAVLKAGGSYVPIDVQSPPSRLEDLIADAGSKIILADGVNANRLLNAKAKLILADKTVEPFVTDSGGSPPERANADSRAYIMYTSGSTGLPKGVEILHRGIVRLVRNTNYVDFQPGDLVAQIASPAFDAITFEVWGALLNGARLLILPSDVVLSPSRFAQAIRSERISTMFLTASLFSVMAETEPSAFGGMRTLIVGGDAVNPAAARKVLATAAPMRLVNGYGPTECTTFSVCHSIRSVPADAKSIPIGRPISNSEAYILDEHLNPVPPGIVGDLFLGGDGLARGYLNRPGLTRERFIPHPFTSTQGARLYKSGDRARFLEDGTIDYAGRIDHQVKFHGYRIELAEIESVLKAAPDVVDCVVTVWNASVNDQRLVAHVACGQHGSTSDRALRCFLLDKLPPYMVPAHFIFLPALPLNGVGKVDRGALPYSSLAHRKDAEAASNLLERQIARIWADVLSLESVARDDNFFELGGSSITLALVEHRLRSLSKKDFATTDLFRFPTVRRLSEFLNEGVKQSGWAADIEKRAARQRSALRGLPR